MRYYDLAGSPNTRRVRIFMAEKDLEIPTTAIDLSKGENKAPEFLAKNSLGKLPVLELDDGSYLCESVAICRYLEELHPEPPLFGRDAKERGLVEMWNRRIEIEIMIPASSNFVHTHEMWKKTVRQVPDWAENCRNQVQARLDWLEKELNGKTYIATDDYTVADITAQCALLLSKATGGPRISDAHPNLSAWWALVTSRPTARA